MSLKSCKLFYEESPIIGGQNTVSAGEYLAPAAAILPKEKFPRRKLGSSGSKYVGRPKDAGRNLEQEGAEVKTLVFKLRTVGESRVVPSHFTTHTDPRTRKSVILTDRLALIFHASILVSYAILQKVQFFSSVKI